MGYVVATIVLVAVLIGGPIALVHYRRHGLRAARAADPDQALNHQAMARLLDQMLANDVSRGAIPAGMKKKAGRLLKRYYGDDSRYDFGDLDMEDDV